MKAYSGSRGKLHLFLTGEALEFSKNSMFSEVGGGGHCAEKQFHFFFFLARLENCEKPLFASS
jgi:hypothetical protein